MGVLDYIVPFPFVYKLNSFSLYKYIIYCIFQQTKILEKIHAEVNKGIPFILITFY